MHVTTPIVRVHASSPPHSYKVSNQPQCYDEEHGSKHRGHNDSSVVWSSGCYCWTGRTAFWSIEAWYSHSTRTWLHRVPPSIYGDCFLCILPLQPISKNALEGCWVTTAISGVYVCPESDIATTAAGEIAIGYYNVLNVWVGALTIRYKDPIQFTLYSFIYKRCWP